METGIYIDSLLRQRAKFIRGFAGVFQKAAGFTIQKPVFFLISEKPPFTPVLRGEIKH